MFDTYYYVLTLTSLNSRVMFWSSVEVRYENGEINLTSPHGDVADIERFLSVADKLAIDRDGEMFAILDQTLTGEVTRDEEGKLIECPTNQCRATTCIKHPGCSKRYSLMTVLTFELLKLWKLLKREIILP